MEKSRKKFPFNIYTAVFYSERKGRRGRTASQVHFEINRSSLLSANATNIN